MFLDLYKLYRKNGYSKRSPLEDFTTEVFAGILKLNPVILEDFIQLIGLPADEYEVKTQIRYSLINRPDCIIDLLLVGKNNICFIENKVNSGEGWEQLDRYCEALNTHYGQIKKHLVYCTKFTDHKNITEHNFKQIRWYQIAEIFMKYMDNDPYLIDYYNFLKHFNMAQKNTFNPEMIISMEKMKDTVETMKLHIENARPYFEEIFNIEKSQDQEASTTGKDRIARFLQPVLPEHKAWSEILYCFKVSKVKLQTQIFIDKSHSQLDSLKEKISSFNQQDLPIKLKQQDHSKGYLIFCDRKIYDLTNDPEADDKIKLWFIDSFHSIAGFIKATPELKWSIQFKNKNIFDEYRDYLLKDNYSSSTIDLYVTLAENVIRAGFNSKNLKFDPENRDLENLEIIGRFTYGDHGASFQGKQSFRRFINLLINKIQRAPKENVIPLLA